MREHQILQANVTVPEQKEGALLGLSRLESSYGSNNKGERINDVWRVGDPLSFNFYYTNFGRVAADSTKGFAKTYIATDRTKTTEVALAEAFKKEADAHMKKDPGVVVPPNPNGAYWITGRSDRYITADDVKKFGDGTEFIYVFSTVTYTDPKGEHYLELCQSMQPPSSADLWNYCTVFHGHK